MVISLSLYVGLPFYYTEINQPRKDYMSITGFLTYTLYIFQFYEMVLIPTMLHIGIKIGILRLNISAEVL